MLKSLRLVNFQAHIDSFIELDEGITSLTGESHEGKTAIMRGLNWAVNNEPSGTGFISYWAKHTTKKGLVVLNTPCKVECVREDGSVLIRERSADFNGYRIDGKDLARAGIGVPAEVNKWFNMGEVNIQGQHDSLFLLHSGGKGGQEVARFLNSVVKLDEIPRALSAIESKKRSTKKLREAESEKIISYEKSIKSLDWVLTTAPIFKRLEKVEKDIVDLENKEETIIEEINRYDGLKGVLDLFKWTEDTLPLVDRWMLNYNKESHLTEDKDSIQFSLTSFEDNQQYLEDHKWLSKAKKALSEIMEVENDINFSILNESTLERNIRKYDMDVLFLEKNKPWLEDATDKIMQLEMLDHTIEELISKETRVNNSRFDVHELERELHLNYAAIKTNKKLLPDVCLLCGAPVKEGKYENSR